MSDGQRKNMIKRVSFNESSNKTHITYSKEEYDRFQIDSILYRYSYQKINQNEWKSVFEELNHYKCTEMIVHRDSIGNLRLHKELTM